MTAATIQLKLFAALTPLTPEDSDRVPITPGSTIKELLTRLEIPLAKAHLIFINGVKRSIDAPLQGGEK